MTARRKWAFERGTLWVSDLDGAARAPVSPRVAVAFGEVRRDAAGRLAAALNLPSADSVEQRFTSGRRCFAAWDDGRIAAYGWVSQGHECVGELERAFRLRPDEAYIWDCLTLPDYRGQRLYSALLSYILAELRAAGIGRAWIGASLDNQPSIKGFMNAGFQPAIRLAYARLLGLRCCWTSSYPGAPARLVAAARRLIIADEELSFGPLIVGAVNIGD